MPRKKSPSRGRRVERRKAMRLVAKRLVSSGTETMNIPQHITALQAVGQVLPDANRV